VSTREEPLRLRVDAVYGPGDVPQPRRIVIGHAVYDVAEIVDRWYEGARVAGGPVRHYFKVRTRTGAVFLLAHGPAADLWTLVRALGREKPPGTRGQRA
jgi:hypothetical protein